MITNIRFVNYNGNSIIDSVIACNSLEISNIKIDTFKKDLNNQNGFKGVIDVLGAASSDFIPNGYSELTGYARNYAKNVSIKNVQLLDADVTINCGLINYVNYVENLSIDHCLINSNSVNAAFINSSRMATYFDYQNSLSSNEFQQVDEYLKAVNCEWAISITNCANYGTSCKLIDLCCADTYTATTKFESSMYKIARQQKKGASKVTIENVANYGDLSSYAFVNSALYTDCVQSSAGDYYSRGHIFTLPSANGYSVSHFVNFGSVKGIAKSNPEGYSSPAAGFTNSSGASFSSVPYTYSYTKPLTYFFEYSSKTISIYSSFNGGTTQEHSTDAISLFNSNYCYELYTELSGEECFNYISNISQITSDFFENTLGLDGNWDLSYIKINDEYGRPSLIFD